MGKSESRNRVSSLAKRKKALLADTFFLFLGGVEVPIFSSDRFSSTCSRVCFLRCARTALKSACEDHEKGCVSEWVGGGRV